MKRTRLKIKSENFNFRGSNPQAQKSKGDNSFNIEILNLAVLSVYNLGTCASAFIPASNLCYKLYNGAN